MPLFRINKELHYFCHVPKCAGASIETHLRARFGEIAFLNSKFFRQSEGHRWTKTSPQHVDAEALSLLFPKGWIRSSFAVVRHPLSRIRSAFDYQRNGEKTLPLDVSINCWIDQYFKSKSKTPYVFDHHLRPACDLVLPGSKIFRLEDGLDLVVPYLDKLARNTSGPRSIPFANKSRSGELYLQAQEPFSDESLAKIADMYKEDFLKFGYECHEAKLKGKPVPKTRKRLQLKTGLLGS